MPEIRKSTPCSTCPLCAGQNILVELFIPFACDELGHDNVIRLILAELKKKRAEEVRNRKVS